MIFDDFPPEKCYNGHGMKRTISTFLLSFVAISCTPSIDINLSECMRSCNREAKSCLDSSDAKINACKDDDAICLKLASNEAKQCMTAAMDCTAACVEEMEQKLKE